MWVKITKIEDSKYNDSQLVFFTFLGETKFSIVSAYVLHYLDVPELRVGQEIYISKSFDKRERPIYLIRKVRNL